MKELMLVGAKRVAVPQIAEDVVCKHEVIKVDDAIGEKLLEQTRLDVANNEHAVWVETSDAEAKAILKEQAEDQKEMKAAATRRKRAVKK